VAAVEPASFPRTSNEQAAYCMEASFGYARQLTRLMEIQRDSREKGQARLAGSNLSPADKAQLVGQMTALDNVIATNDAKKKSWDANVGVFITYLQKNNLFAKDPTLIASMSGLVRREQEAVQSTRSACLRSCAPNDAACRGTCNEKANGSDANVRMQRCAEIVMRFK
jgi:hypothetical protein